MVDTREERCASRVAGVLQTLPKRLSGEILRLAEGRLAGVAGIREIRLRPNARCELLIADERLPLSARPTAEEISEILGRVTEGGLYAHRDSISEGYIPMRGGVRVGISGRARYEGGRIVGISDTSSLVFRIPREACDFAEGLFSVWREEPVRGMLIYSPPGVGKTTALKSLAALVGGGRCGRRVCIVDERCEFDPETYADSSVDVLSGYRKAVGIEIATRTLSPEIIMVDELFADDARAVAEVARCGVPIVATAHADSFGEVISRAGVSELYRGGIFSVFVGIRNTPPTYLLTVTRIGADGAPLSERKIGADGEPLGGEVSYSESDREGLMLC